MRWITQNPRESQRAMFKDPVPTPLTAHRIENIAKT